MRQMKVAKGYIREVNVQLEVQNLQRNTRTSSKSAKNTSNTRNTCTSSATLSTTEFWSGGQSITVSKVFESIVKGG